MKYLLFSLFVVLTTFSSTFFAQEWIEYYHDNEVIIEVAEWNRVDQKYGKDHQQIIFQYKNLTDHDVTISFTRELEYEEGGTATQEVIYFVHLGANEMKTYFDHPKDKAYYIFKKDNNGWINDKLIDFKIIDLLIE